MTLLERLAVAPGSSAADLQMDRGTFKAEALAQLVHQIPFVRKMQVAGLVRKNNKRRGPDTGLRNVEYFPVFEVQGFDEPVQLAGGHAMKSRLIDAFD